MERVSAGNLNAMPHRGARLDEPANARSEGLSALMTAPSMPKRRSPRWAPSAARASRTSLMVGAQHQPGGGGGGRCDAECAEAGHRVAVAQLVAGQLVRGVGEERQGGVVGAVLGAQGPGGAVAGVGERVAAGSGA